MNTPVVRDRKGWFHVLRGVFLAGLWVMACPWVLSVSGYVRWFGLWCVAGVVVWRWFPWLLADTLAWTQKRQRLWRAMDETPWRLLPGALVLLAATGFYGLGFFAGVMVLGKALPWALLSVLLGAVGVWWWLKPGKEKTGWLSWLGLLTTAGLGLLARTFLGGEGGRGLDLPIVLVSWLAVAAVVMKGRWLGAGRWLTFGAAINLALATLALEFYIAPLNSQVRQVLAQPGVRLLHHKPRLDYRWAVQGCAPGRYWLGTRVMSGLGKTVTLVRRQLAPAPAGAKGFSIGGGTADNAAVDCSLRLVMVGDQGHRGGVYVLSETDGGVLYRTPRPTRFESGVTGVAYIPSRGWLFGAKEAENYRWWLDVKIPRQPVVRQLSRPGSGMAACQSLTGPCAVSVSQRWVSRHGGDRLGRVATVARQGRSLAPGVAVDDRHQRIYVSDLLLPRVMALRVWPLRPVRPVRTGVGVRYMVAWPRDGEVWGANFLNGWLVSWNEKGRVRRRLFAGRKARALNLTRDGRGLLWCAASACYEYRPKHLKQAKNS